MGRVDVQRAEIMSNKWNHHQRRRGGEERRGEERNRSAESEISWLFGILEAEESADPGRFPNLQCKFPQSFIKVRSGVDRARMVAVPVYHTNNTRSYRNDLQTPNNIFPFSPHRIPR